MARTWSQAWRQRGVNGLQTVLEGEDDGPIQFGGLGTERLGESPGEGQHERGELSRSIWQPPHSRADGNEASASREMHFFIFCKF